ncbi:MAG: DUF4401 domain-containing protein [Flammeovirgaceae bacterium]
METGKSSFRKQLKLGSLLEQWEESHPNSLPYGDKQFQQELAEKELSTSGITIQVFTAIGSWIAALMFIAFLALARIIDSEEAALVAGIVFTLGYLIVSFAGKIKPAFEAFTLAIGMIGQCLLGIGLSQVIGVNSITFYVLCILIEALILLISFSAIQRFISTILIFLSFLGLFYEFKIYEACHLIVGLLSFVLAYFWMNEPKVLAQDKRLANFMNPVGLGLAVSIITLLLFSINKEWYRDYINYWWVSGIMMVLSVMYVVHAMLKSYRATEHQWLAFAGIALMLGPTIFSPGIAAAIFILLLGFYRGHYILSGLGVLSLILFTTMFYYNLQLTLLHKSILLLVVGAVFLLVRLGLNKLIVKQEALNRQFGTEENRRNHETD